MILCRNGHENPDGATTCAVCGIDITPLGPAPVPAPPVVTLSETSLRTAADELVTCQLAIQNVGGVADEFEIALLGEAAAFGSAEPSKLVLEPAASGVAQLTFRPPASAEGARAFEARVTSKHLPAAPVSTLGLVEVTAPAGPVPIETETEEEETQVIEPSPPPPPPTTRKTRPKWLIALVVLALLATVVVIAVVMDVGSDDGIAGTVTTRRDNLNLREAPDDDSDVTGSVKRGATVRIQCIAHDPIDDEFWYLITSPERGYVFAANVVPSERPDPC